MRKLKIYLDTSVISHLKQDDTPEKMQDTLKLWEMFRNGKYEAVISSVALDEISGCKPEKYEYLMTMLSEIEYTVIMVDDTTVELAEKIIDFGILRQKSYDDCLHIAAAIVSNCDVILSWNFKHIVNHRTIQGVKIITTAEGYKDMIIYSPTILIEGDEEDGKIEYKF